MMTEDQAHVINRLFTDIQQIWDGNVSMESFLMGADSLRRIILLIPIILFAVLLVRLIFSYLTKEQGRMRLRIFALMTLISGWTLYYVGFFFKGTSSSFFAYFVRPLIAAIGMFVGSTGYQEISEECAKSPMYMTFFAVIHLAAILVSAIFVINFFWKRSKSYLRGKWWFCFPSSSPLNIFFGFNEQSIILAHDIQDKKKGKEHIIFIDIPTANTEQKEELSLSQLFGFSAYHQEYVNQLNGVNYAIKSALGIPSDLDAENSNTLELLHLRSIKKLIQRHRLTRIFFLSKNEDGNVKSVINILKDNVCKHYQIEIYCHARRNKENGVIEKMAYLENEETHPNIHLIDSAHLSIETLKKDVKYQPVSFVSPDTAKGTVDNAFNALVIGFGESGRDAVRFLYEFGSFVGSDGQKSPFKCYAIDQHMSVLSGGFYNNAPALVGNEEIELLQMKEQSEEFWMWMSDHLISLNYILVAVGDDYTGMQLAIDLLDNALRINKEMKRFKIFVRSYLKENENRMREMVNFYNEKLGEVLVLFGSSKTLYTYKTVIDEEALQQAKEFYAGYASKKVNDPTWEERHIISTKEERNGVITYRKKKREDVTLDDINSVIRKENQDLANSRHIETKLALVGLSRKSGKDEFDKLTGEQRRNLAICEHLRWTASHEIIGYVYGEKDDNLRKTHTCMKPWQDLSEQYQGYDYSVMDRTIDIVLNSNENK
ncbi:MAG: hypothetical protein IJ633_04375 [Prevotella sp.]|nr:hypothetical protein [Prevotella sp.]